VLFVDDDAAIRKVVTALLEQSGIPCEEAASGEAALNALAEGVFGAVLIDLRMPGRDGMSVLSEIVMRWPLTAAVVLTAHGTVPLAVEAMRLGAADFILKPFEREQLLEVTCKALELTRRRRESARPSFPTRQLLGASRAMHDVLDVLSRVARGNSTVLVRGETGTGKEVVARVLHSSSRAGKPFVKVDCASLPDALLESELFGYEKGAFTGAVCRKPGRVELARGGTLFLDEIGEVTPALQKKLLRLLQDREFERLGGVSVLKADVRFVAATHRDLEAMIVRGDFRQDLFYRLNVVPLWLPPLRDRRADIPELARHFCALAAAANHVSPPELGDDALAALSSHSWPGNIRELEHFLERLVVLLEGSRIGEEHVVRQLAMVRGASTPAIDTNQPASVTRASDFGLSTQRRTAEREALSRALRSANGNRTAAARLLGVSRRTLHYKLKELGVDLGEPVVR
jgi:two-component system response regulator AtoC